MLNFIIFLNFTFEIGATEHYKFPYFGSENKKPVAPLTPCSWSAPKS